MQKIRAVTAQWVKRGHVRALPYVAAFAAANIAAWMMYMATRPTPMATVQACEKAYQHKITDLTSAHGGQLGAQAAAFADSTAVSSSRISKCETNLSNLKKNSNDEITGCRKQVAALTDSSGVVKKLLGLIEKQCDGEQSASQALNTSRALADRARRDVPALLLAYESLRAGRATSETANPIVSGLQELLAIDVTPSARSPSDHLLRLAQYLDRSPGRVPTHTLPELYLPHLDRQSNSILLLFDANKRTLFAMLSKEAYAQSYIRVFVHGLRTSHALIQPVLGGADAIDVSKIHTVCDPAEATVLRRTTLGTEHAFATEYAKHISSLSRWVCTFWVRRAREGNVDAVKSILDQLAKHYGDPSITLRP